MACPRDRRESCPVAGAERNNSTVRPKATGIPILRRTIADPSGAAYPAEPRLPAEALLSPAREIARALGCGGELVQHRARALRGQPAQLGHRPRVPPPVDVEGLLQASAQPGGGEH